MDTEGRLTVGSLFSGIGGLELGLERAGFELRWQCEINPYCRKVLAKHWPNVPCYEDVRSLPDDIERVDLICGGYPCQPFSLAGTRTGTDDPRHLWPAFADTIRLLRPRFALLENVPGHLSLGFDGVLGDLAALGYDAEWTCIPAAAVGAPHLRWRLFVLAYANGEGEPGQPVDAFAGPRIVVHGRVADSERAGLQGRTRSGSRRSCVIPAEGCEGDRGQWNVEPNVGRVANGVPSRVDRLKALGNAVVPQVAEFIGRQLLAHIGAIP